jgi:hypothetical protein
VRYYSYVEGEPTLDAYRLSHGPREDLSPVFLCPFFVVSDAEGNLYNGMRGVQATDKGTTMNMGVYRLNGKFDEQCPYLFPWADAPASESYWVVEDRDAVSYVGDHHRLDFGIDEYGWEDASQKVMLRAKRLGQVCTFWVPRQEGIEYPQMLRSHLGKATGTIEGKPVEGLFMLDYIYSRPDAMWSEMGMLTKLHNIWLNWLVEYEDGSYEGGLGFRGGPSLCRRGQRRPLGCPHRRSADGARHDLERLTRARARSDGRALPARFDGLAASHVRRGRVDDAWEDGREELELHGVLSDELPARPRLPGGAPCVVRQVAVVRGPHGRRADRRPAARLRQALTSIPAARDCRGS